MATLNGHRAGPIRLTKSQEFLPDGIQEPRMSIKASGPQKVGYKEPPHFDLSVTSDSHDASMTGQKIYAKERPDDGARHLASMLTLDEQVRPEYITHSKISSNSSRFPCSLVQTFGGLCPCQEEEFLLSRPVTDPMELAVLSSKMAPL